MSEHPVTPAYAFDPELAGLAALSVSAPPTSAVEARAVMAEMMAAMAVGLDESDLDIDDRTIPGPPGDPDVAVRVYAPKVRPTAIVPAILYIHGGGFYVGSIDTEHAGSARLAQELGVVVVSVEYRLAPEHPFPAGIEDCYAALAWLHAQADELGVDPARVAVNGGSAGGGLAAGLALLARDRGGPAICFQCLGIPELDDTLETPSMQRFLDTPMWSRPQAVQSWQWYLGDAYGTDDVSPYAAPARATDLARLPPAYVSTMEFDPLHDEGILYALKMLSAGVSVELHSFPGTFHGSAMVTGAAVTQRSGIETITVLRRALGLDGH